MLIVRNNRINSFITANIMGWKIWVKKEYVCIDNKIDILLMAFFKG